MKRLLKPPKNFRSYRPRICYWCRYMIYPGDGTWYCERDAENVGGDAGDGFERESTCDRWRKL